MSLTLLVGVDAIVRVQLLVSLLFVDGLAEYSVPVHDVDRLFFTRAPRGRHRCQGKLRVLTRYAHACA